MSGRRLFLMLAIALVAGASFLIMHQLSAQWEAAK
jgi:hypothetical protein